MSPTSAGSKNNSTPPARRAKLNPEAPSDARKPRVVRKQRQEVIRHGQPEKLSLQVRKAAEHTHFCVDIRVFYSTHLKKTDEVILKVAVTIGQHASHVALVSGIAV